MTAAGSIRLQRQSFRCPTCGLSAVPLEEHLGLDGFLSPQATRLACLATASWSFAVAADRLAELAGVTLDDETLRRHVEQAAARLEARRKAAEPAATRFAAAPGAVEFLVDGVFVPTRNGWRELKLARFQKRVPGAAAAPEAWARRLLPPPTADVAYGSLEESAAFTAQWRPWAQRLGVTEAKDLTVLADGAEWIWAGVAEQFPGARGVLDIFHAVEHVAAVAGVLYGPETPAATAWTERGRRALLGDGWLGLCDVVGATLAAGVTPAGQEALDGLVSYFAKHTAHVGYYRQLQRGQAIGSGAVEGLAARMGRRLKTAGQGWREAHVGPMATLVALVQTPEWPDLWEPSLN